MHRMRLDSNNRKGKPPENKNREDRLEAPSRMDFNHHQWERVTIELRTRQNMHMRRMHIIMVIPIVPCCFMFELSFFTISIPISGLEKV